MAMAEHGSKIKALTLLVLIECIHEIFFSIFADTNFTIKVVTRIYVDKTSFNYTIKIEVFLRIRRFSKCLFKKPFMKTLFLK